MLLKTERLIIRPTIIQDLDQIHLLLSDPETMHFFVEGTYSKEKVRDMITRNQKEQHHYTVLLKSSNRIIGKLSYNPWFMKNTKEIGWIFFKTATNKGYCTEAAKAILKYAFEQENIHRMIATCQPENIASKRVCEKLGMRQEGNFKQSIHVKNDVWWDELHYGILQDDYNKHKE